LETAIRNDHHGNAVSFNETHTAECGRTQSNETSHVPQTHASITQCAEDMDLEDTNCIPDTQLVQSSHCLTCLPANASSPDVDMIPDTPDSMSVVRASKTFQRSYLTSRSNLLAACDDHLQKKTSPPQRKMTKGKSRLHKHASLSANTVQECASLSFPGDATSVTDFPQIIPHRVFTSHLPYPSGDALNKRCATDPLPLSKRSDHKITPTKPVSLTSSDAVYGTVPSRLFQEALNREKHQQLSAPRRNKENLKPNVSAEEIGESSVLDSDPVLLEVLGELKVDSPKNESVQNIPITLSSRAGDSCVSDNVISQCRKTADGHLETLCRDDDLEDILGELRQQNGIHCSDSHTALNDGKKNQASLHVNDVRDCPSSFSTATLCLDSVNIAVDRSLAKSNESGAQLGARDLTFTGLKLEEHANDSAGNSVEGCLKSMCSDVVDGDSVSCVQSVFDDISDSKFESDISFSATCDPNAMYGIFHITLYFMLI